MQDLKEGQIEVRASVTALREDVHGLRGDVLRQERAVASLEADVQRINRRLDIVNVQAS